MDDPGQHPCIRVRRRNVRMVNEHKDKIRELFAVRLSRKTSPQRHRAPQQLHQDVSKSSFVYLNVEPDKSAVSSVCLSEITPRLQMFVDSLCGGGGATVAATAAEAAGDDSSYDSDYEDKDEAEHADVSRTVSDTLGAEFAEYVSRSATAAAHQTLSPANSINTLAQQQGYAARVEFGLKLGYTERLVQAALAKLGPSPGQNELLEELIRLGARAAAAAAAVAAAGGVPAAAAAAAVASGGGGGTTVVAGGAGVAAGAGADAVTAAAAAASVVVDPEALALAESLAAATLAAQEAEEAAAAAAAAGPLAAQQPAQLRHIVIDGSNVAMSHGNKEVFSCRGIRICVDWFRARGHRDITVFVPKWRKEASRPDNPVTDQEILTELERERLLVFTPSKLVGGKRIVCYDDRYVLRLAAETDGIVVSNDNYRDLAQESPEFRRVVEERILMYSFVNDRFMPPDDPLGRAGPTLDHFLRCPAGGSGMAGGGATAGAAGASATPRRPGEPPPQLCPYGKKCTYGNKCKYQHPERGPLPQKSVTEKLAEHHKQQMQARGQAAAVAAAVAAGNPATKSVSLPLPGCIDSPDKAPRKTPLSRTRSNVPGLHPPVPGPTITPEHADHPSSAGVPKSRSVENIQGGGCASYLSSGPTIAPPQGYGLWARPDPALPPPSTAAPPQTWCPPHPHRSTGLVFGDQGGHVAVAQRLSDPESTAPESANHHRKLQRQLTLNPACDPRLQQLRAVAPQHHRPTARMSSGPETYGWETHSRPPPPLSQHQHVTRNASAPDSYRPGVVWNPPPGTPAGGAAAAALMGRNMFRHGSTSDPQINLCVEPTGDPFDTPVWPQQHHPPQQGSLMWGPPPPPSTEEARRMMHYHLSALFPPEQVQQAMRMFPEETSAQKICAAILAMFPVKP